MLFPYLLLVFALTSVAAAREKWEGLLPLLLSKDLRLTEEGYRFIWLMSVKLAASRPRDRLYDDNIQFGTAPTITHFKLKRKFQPPSTVWTVPAPKRIIHVFLIKLSATRTLVGKTDFS